MMTQVFRLMEMVPDDDLKHLGEAFKEISGLYETALAAVKEERGIKT